MLILFVLAHYYRSCIFNCIIMLVFYLKEMCWSTVATCFYIYIFCLIVAIESILNK